MAMAKEIERKFLVKNLGYRNIAKSKYVIKQGYLSTNKEATVRIRIKDSSAFITIKGLSVGASRDEWEYAIPYEDALSMIKLSSGNTIEKTRYIVEFEGYTWEIDEFEGRHNGLIVAEIELTDENETFPIPPFIGKEVTGNVKYYNSTLSKV